MPKEHDLDLTYVVNIRTYGKALKTKKEIGQRLARELGIMFKDVEVTSGRTKYSSDETTWGRGDDFDPTDDLFDDVNDSGVTS